MKIFGGALRRSCPRSAGSSPSPAPPHRRGPPVDRPNQWFFYSSVEELDQLMEALNPRGYRESGLKEALLQDRERLLEALRACQRSKYTGTGTKRSRRQTSNAHPRDFPWKAGLALSCQIRMSRMDEKPPSVHESALCLLPWHARPPHPRRLFVQMTPSRPDPFPNAPRRPRPSWRAD